MSLTSEPWHMDAKIKAPAGGGGNINRAYNCFKGEMK